MFIKFTCVVALLCILSGNAFAAASAVKYKNDFAFLTKSFHRDLERSLVMYKSVEKHFNAKVPFYLVVPREDLPNFLKLYNNSLKNNEISQVPTFITEEEVLQKCHIPQAKINHLKAKPRSGWLIQQVIKFCFHSTNLAKDYMSIDSDIYFTRNFTKEMLYHDSTLKTVGRILGNGSESSGQKKFNKVKKLGNVDPEQAYRYQSHSFIRYIFKGGLDPWYDFVSGFALWSSDILYQMGSYIKAELDYDFADLINLVPWEMQWYGQFVMSQNQGKFHLFKSNFVTGIADQKEEEKFIHCTPTQGYPGTYGIQYQPHAVGRKDLVYTAPNTAKCKVKNFFRSAGYKIKSVFVKD